MPNNEKILTKLLDADNSNCGKRNCRCLMAKLDMLASMEQQSTGEQSINEIIDSVAIDD